MHCIESRALSWSDLLFSIRCGPELICVGPSRPEGLAQREPSFRNNGIYPKYKSQSRNSPPGRLWSAIFRRLCREFCRQIWMGLAEFSPTPNYEAEPAKSSENIGLGRAPLPRARRSAHVLVTGDPRNKDLSQIDSRRDRADLCGRILGLQRQTHPAITIPRPAGPDRFWGAIPELILRIFLRWDRRTNSGGTNNPGAFPGVRQKTAPPYTICGNSSVPSMTCMRICNRNSIGLKSAARAAAASRPAKLLAHKRPRLSVWADA